MEYNVDANGKITDLGKFEGEQRYVPYYWDCCLQGMFAEDIDNVFFLPFDKDDYAKYPELEGTYGIALEESDQGFVWSHVYDTQAQYNKAVEAREESELNSADQE